MLVGLIPLIYYKSVCTPGAPIRPLYSAAALMLDVKELFGRGSDPRPRRGSSPSLSSPE